MVSLITSSEINKRSSFVDRRICLSAIIVYPNAIDNFHKAILIHFLCSSVIIRYMFLKSRYANQLRERVK